MMSPNPPLQGSLAVSLSNISQFLPSEPLENSYLGPSFCAPPARFTSDHNGFGSSWFWPKRFYPFTAIILKSGGTRSYRALFSPISLSANLPRFKPNLTGQSNNPPFTDSCLRFKISWHVWVTFLLGYPIRTFTVTCSHVFMGSATYVHKNADPPLLPIALSVY